MFFFSVVFARFDYSYFCSKSNLLCWTGNFTDSCLVIIDLTFKHKLCMERMSVFLLKLETHQTERLKSEICSSSISFLFCHEEKAKRAVKPISLCEKIRGWSLSALVKGNCECDWGWD